MGFLIVCMYCLIRVKFECRMVNVVWSHRLNSKEGTRNNSSLKKHGLLCRVIPLEKLIS